MPFTEPKGVTNSECIHLDFVTDCLGRILFFSGISGSAANQTVTSHYLPFHFPGFPIVPPATCTESGAVFSLSGFFPGSFTAEKRKAASTCRRKSVD
ncbi:uncharacterized protein TNIN_150961 [Trichonephila inaurata madagascariensis]|uniref:Uncharacterized protein n=1 Tax=Trichonephila inaurata madagascariensis TaxID=2747483 RepID=A0A8X7CEJ3_9ARAC|nr:uncharacterized protein TNIN_150961 [Trichonephila inaurata madagascariensis]